MSCLLSSELSITQQIDIAALAISTVLSVLLIFVSVINIVISIRSINESTRFPIRSNLVAKLFNYDKQFYNLCTKIIVQKVIDNESVKKNVVKLDDLNTELFGCINIMESVFPKNKEMIKNLNILFDAAEDMCIAMENCQDYLVDDIKKANENIYNKNIEYKSLFEDLLEVPEKFKFYIEELNEDTVEFLKLYVKVYQLLKNIDYKSFMKPTSIIRIK